MSNPISSSQARIIDPILTSVARGYKQVARFAFMLLFPIVPVNSRGGKVIQFNAQSFAEYNTGRAPGENIATAEFGYSDQEYALKQNALAFKVPVEHLQEAQAVPGIDLGKKSVMTGMDIISLTVERNAATLATTSANYNASHVFTLAGASQFDHADAAPSKLIESKKELIAEDIGRDPNIMVMGPDVFRALKNNPDVIDRIKHTEGLTGTSAPTINAAKLAQYFDVDMVINAGVRSESEDGKLKPVWGKNIVLAYSEIGTLADMGTPSFGYTYRLRNYPIAKKPYFEANQESWFYPIFTEDTSVIAGKDAGMLFQSVVS